MEPLTFVRDWISDMHRIGCTVSEPAAREAQRVVSVAEAAGVPPSAAIALARDVLRRDRSGPQSSRAGIEVVTRERSRGLRR